jgi:hypothetical protein
MMSEIALQQHNPYQSFDWTEVDPITESVYGTNLLRVIRGEPFEVPPCCEAPGCAYEYRRQKKVDELTYLSHAKEKHRVMFIDCQWYRIKCGEIPVPSDVIKGDYLREIMQFIGDKQKTVSCCLVPGCPRTVSHKIISSIS